jgi:O-antigen biosynthesis protein
VEALRQVFVENPWVSVVTGLVLPHELETPEQIWFEMQGGFGRGCDRKWLWFPEGKGLRWYDLGTGNYGTGANMAFRRGAVVAVGGFDPALDVGTATQGAGDLEMFLRLLRSGHGLVYEPQAIVWHRHRREYDRLSKQLSANGSVYSMFVATATKFPDLIPGMLRLGLSWGFWGNTVPWLASLTHSTIFPRDLRWMQLWGCWQGLWRYQPAKQRARRIAQQYGELDFSAIVPTAAIPPLATAGIGVYPLELTQPLPASIAVPDCHTTRLFVTYQGSPVNQIDLTHYGQPIGRLQLLETLVNYISMHLYDPYKQRDWQAVKAEALLKIRAQALPDEARPLANPSQPGQPQPLPRLDPAVSVSIVIGTFNRPQALERCLKSLQAQETERSVEIIVVDNCPGSGQTAPIVAQFEAIRYVAENRQGVAYARNAGIVFSSGEVVVTVDDDVVIPSDWLEKLIAPLARADVMGVTGNVLPWQLETQSQQLFEGYGNGGLGRGFGRFEVGRTWFERSAIHAVPTWELGGTANSAYRSQIFHDPKIGLMDTALGPGMPSGVGEDIYLFYKILKAGDTMVYEPTAHVWHEHRRDMLALRRQIYGYSKGFTSYHLTTLWHDRDLRALVTLFIFLPLYHCKQILNWFQGARAYPLSMILWEIWGNLMGFIALPQSRQKVKQLDRAHPTLPLDALPKQITS